TAARRLAPLALGYGLLLAGNTPASARDPQSPIAAGSIVVGAVTDSLPAQLATLTALSYAARYAAADSAFVSLLAGLAAAGLRDSSATADVLDRWVINRILWARFAEDTVRAGAERSLAIRSRIYGASSVEAARSLNVLGRLASYRSRPTEADSLLRRALAIEEHELGPNDPMVGETLVYLGNLHVVVGSKGKARDEYSRALEIAKRQTPPDP